MFKFKQDLTYRTKLILFFLTAIAITSLAGLYSYVSTSLLIKDITNLMNNSQQLTTMYRDIGEIQKFTEDYLQSRSSESLRVFYSYSNSISTQLNGLQKNVQYSNRGIKIINLTEMVSHYVEVLEETILAKRNNKIEEYADGYQEAIKEYRYIGTYIESIMTQDLTDSAQKYTEIQNEINRSSAINYLIFSITIILIIFILVLFSYEMTKPISKLAYYAREIARGRFDIELPEQKTSSEITILYKTFGRMAYSIRKYINEMKEKQLLESTLSEEKVKNLEMSIALNKAELTALQAQINPHFIFNTINIGANLAMLQGDDTTSEYLNNFADILRYNLRGLSNDATLQEEVENVKSYMSLLKTRFGNSIHFRLTLPEDEGLLQICLPRLTLQPILENAFIHGISKLEDGGVIELNVDRRGTQVLIDISNTGPEIPVNTISMILSGKYQSQKKQQKNMGHTTGIGIDNVLSRLRLYYGIEEVMDIVCSQGITHFIIMLPLGNQLSNGDEVKND